MRVLFDTNVLIAAFFHEHPHHEPSLSVVNRHNDSNAFISTHSLAEFYASATRMPLPLRAEPHQAWEGLQPLIERATLIELKSSDYYRALSMLAQCDMGGAIIYDALILLCAQQAEVDILYTWNIKHFTRIPQMRPLKILTPDHA